MSEFESHPVLDGPLETVAAVPPRRRSRPTQAGLVLERLAGVPSDRYAIVATLRGLTDTSVPSTNLVTELRARGVEAESRTTREDGRYVLRVYARGTAPVPIDLSVEDGNRSVGE